MFKRGIAVLMTAAILLGSLSACGVRGAAEQSGDAQGPALIGGHGNSASDALRDGADERRDENGMTDEEGLQAETDRFNESRKETAEEAWWPLGDNYWQDTVLKTRDADVIPCVEPYAVESDLSNIDNLWQFYLTDEVADKLARNGFVVYGHAGREFFEIYELNRYERTANFVTVDSLMHTYHLYFSYLMKSMEKTGLLSSMEILSKWMLDDSVEAYETLKGTEWENAAKRNVAYFNVAVKLLDENTKINGDVKDIVEYELSQINSASGMAMSKITGVTEDYTQYVPRGYYEGDEDLERYFRTMMWYGRIHFRQDDEDLDRSAMLIALNFLKYQKDEAFAEWETVYDTTTFFAGESDDLTVLDYIPLVEELYGSQATVKSLLDQPNQFAVFHAETAKLAAPQIGSVQGGEERGFRFMGQRFTIDANIMQRLIYGSVGGNSVGEARRLPDVLDVPAALGSDVALSILEQQGDTDYAGYTENMEELREYLAQDNEELWSASLYTGWLNTLRPLLDVKGEGYPMFMQGEEWAKKDLECFAGSYAELKHDTILYTKQVIAEMGGDGWDQEPDDRGYVEPEPLVYAHLASLSAEAAEMLVYVGVTSEELGVLDRNLIRLSQISDTLLEISKKELLDETLTDEEYDFIRNYGGYIEHFWIDVTRDESGGEYVATQECPAAIVADIATDAGGQVLEVGTDDPSLIRVIVKVDGKLKIAQGSVYSFYQFTWPMDDRLTDSKWHQMLGIKPNADGNFEQDESITKPEWTESYRN
ncbi:MAG: DUF3160 domain-containing protein [Lachnospiraceae bacterium]|nr:DUF3160 domain-containing protein [Lachnospiraceae bacterium]